MAYKSILSEDRVVFILGDDTVIELNSYDKVKQLIGASNENLDLLIQEINDNLISYANEELSKMVDGTGSLLQKTGAYVRLLQVVGQYFYLEEQKRLAEEQQERDASGIAEESI